MNFDELERYSQEAVLARMLARAPQQMDKREGSILYDALSPCAYALAQGYLEAYALYRENSVLTASGAWLEGIAGEIGLARRAASGALVRAQTTAMTGAEIGYDGAGRFALEGTGLIYRLSEDEGSGSWLLACEQAGAQGNKSAGKLLAMADTRVSGLERLEITALVTAGEDEEEDEALRERMRRQWASQPADGNQAQYERWVGAYAGIGAYRLIAPEESGNGKIRIILCDTRNRGASAELVEAFQAYIDPQGAGLGLGKAPIGARIEAMSAGEAGIDIEAAIVLRAGAQLSQIEAAARAAAERYFAEIAFKKSTVSYYKLVGLLVDLIGVERVALLKAGGGSQNLPVSATARDLPVGATDVPILRSLTLSVATE